MSYQVLHVGGNQWELRFDSEPDYCYPLPIADAAERAKVSQGTWLVLFSAVWSGPDQEAITTALRVVKKFGGQVKLGVRPFDETTEFRQWFPEIRETYGSPVWVVVKDGCLVEQFVGLVAAAVLEEALRRSLPSAVGRDANPSAISRISHRGDSSAT